MNKVTEYLSLGSLNRDVPPDALLGAIAHYGSLEKYYNACISNAQMAVSAPFPPNAHEVIEKAVTLVQKKRLRLVADLIAAGLTTPLPNWWAVPSLRRGNLGEGGTAHRTMVPDSRGERFVLQRGGTSWPIFCTWSNFSFDIRSVAIADRMGAPLDTTHTTEATYRVNEAIEDQAWNGLTDDQGNVMTIDGMSAPGILSSTTTFDYADWTTLTGAQIIDVVLGAIELLRITHPGPYSLRIPGNYSKTLNKQYTTTYPGTVRQALEQLGPYGGKTLQISLDDTAPDHRVVLIQMDPMAVDVVIGQQPVPVSWTDGPKWNTYWVVLSCVIFRMFADANGLYGVAVGNKT